MTYRFFVIALLTATACEPTLPDDASRADVPRVLAVRSDPPEAKPGDPVTLHALYTVNTNVDWSLCVTRKALADNSPIAIECIESPQTRIPFGSGESAVTKIPTDSCRIFGPDPPSTGGGRPADPDDTGGYYQPGLAADAVFQVRIRCNLAGATEAQLTDFENRYQANTNPDFDTITFNGVAATDTFSAAAGTKIHIVASWPAAAAENYVAYDPVSRSIQNRRESLRVSWLATTGTFALSRTGAEENDPSTSTGNDYTVSGDATLYFVLRDARGGTAYRTIALTTTP